MPHRLLYAALAHAGYIDRSAELGRLREVDSPIQGHPILGLVPGVEATTGSLGQGLIRGRWARCSAAASPAVSTMSTC